MRSWGEACAGGRRSCADGERSMSWGDAESLSCVDGER